MKIAFRADGNPEIGSGHIMRCLSIANAFAENGVQCSFILSDNGMKDLIISRGHEAEILNSRFDRMYSETNAFCDIVKSIRPKTVFIDSYYVTEEYLNSVHRFCADNGIVLVYIDDVLAFPYSCDILINYNIYSSEAEYNELYRGKKIPELLLGTAYAPLRKEFHGLSDRKILKNANRILISTGGSDPDHMALELVRLISEHKEWAGYGFHFVIGALNNDKDEIEALSSENTNIKLHINVKNMSELMQTCDVAISAAGSTLYELCATQTPTITYILADNQIPGAEAFQRKEIMISAGDIRTYGVERLSENVLRKATALLNDCGKRTVMADMMKNVADGNGAQRIADHMI